MAAPSPARSFWGTMALVFLAIAAISAADMFLASTERAEGHVQAAQMFERGRVLMQRGDNAEAIEPIKDAIAVERGNRDFMRTLALAQLAAGKTAEAESTLTELLQTDSTDGLASLIVGRVLVKEGRFAEAISYFHRAVYGRWSQDAAGNQLRARFELIDLLAQRDSKEELLAELLPVEERAPRDLRTRARLGQLFLLAGSPARAAVVFRGILHESPTDADAYAGLGEAEFAQNNYRAAQRDFQSALRMAPDNQAARQSLDRCNELLMLDPTVRGLSQDEYFRRSLKLVELTMGEASQCAGQHASPELQGLLDNGARALKSRVRSAHLSEASEANLDLAERLWQSRRKDCATTPGTDSPLAIVLSRLAQ